MKSKSGGSCGWGDGEGKAKRRRLCGIIVARPWPELSTIVTSHEHWPTNSSTSADTSNTAVPAVRWEFGQFCDSTGIVAPWSARLQGPALIRCDNVILTCTRKLTSMYHTIRSEIFSVAKIALKLLRSPQERSEVNLDSTVRKWLTKQGCL